MVIELKNENDLQRFIECNRIALLAIANKNDKNWRYVEYLLKRLENKAGYMISFGIVHVDIIRNTLKEFEQRIAEREVLIRLYFEGNCIFEQEGLFGHILSDEQALKRGIKEVLKKFSIKTLF